MVKYDSTYALATNAGSSAKATAQYIILHDTGNANNTGNNSAENEAIYMKGHWQDAYTHAIAGWDRVYLIGEPGYVAYGAGSPANERSPFQIELARYADQDKAIAAYQNWIAAAIYYADKYSIPHTLDGSGNGIKSHKWVSDNLWGDHQDPYAYLTSIGISKTQIAADLKAGKATTSTTAPSKPSATKPATSKPAAKPTAKKPAAKTVNVMYGFHQLGGGWLGEVTNFGSGDNGYAGVPNKANDYFYAKVSRGGLKFRVHTVKSGWLPWITKGNRADLINGCAGIKGEAIDAVELIYTTPAGEPYQQAYYRSQTTKRVGYLGVVCDDGKSLSAFKDSYAGIIGEPMDRIQVKIEAENPF